MLAFLNPLFWIGIIAVGAPIWLHLRRKDREKVIFFAALRFLDDQPEAKQPPWHLKNVILFLLRVLALLLLIAAFAQPYFRQFGGSSTTSTVYVLDNTMSRQAEKGLEHDRDYLIDQISRAGSREQIAVVELTHQPRVVVNFGDSPDQAKAKLEALQPTAQRGTMLSALRQADYLIKQSLGENKQIIVLSDEQKNQWTENANSPPFLEPGQVSLPTFPKVTARPNFYVSDPKLQRVFLGDTTLIQFSAQINRTGDVHAATVTLTSNGREILHRSFELDARTDKVGVVTQWEADSSKWMQGSISVKTAQPDDLPIDDTAYFTMPPVIEGKVALLSESVYLKTALSGAVSRGHWNVQTLQPAKLADVLSAPADSDADILMIDGNYLQSDQARQLVQRYLHAGRGVFIMVGQLSTLLTGFLEDMGYDPVTRLAPAPGAPFEPIRYFSTQSPIFKPFTVPDFCNLLEVRMGETAHLSARSAKPLLFAQNGDPLLYEGSKDNGRYLLSTFAFERSQTNWVIHPSFLPFLDSALEYLRPQSTLNSTQEPGDIWLAQVPPTRDVKNVVLTSSDGRVIERVAVNANHHAMVPAPDEPGIYGLSYDQDPAVRQMLAVNTPSQESDLSYLQSAPDMLKAWTMSKATEPARRPTTPTVVLMNPANENLWWVFVLAGFTALFLEMIELARRGHA